MLNKWLHFAEPHHSYVLSFGLGMVLAFFSLLLQKPAAICSKYLEDRNLWLVKIGFEDVFMSLATAASINVWRGVWGLCDEFVFPQDRILSYWTCHVVGMGGLMLMFHGSSALAKGFQIDGEFTQGQGCILPASSFTIFKRHMGVRFIFDLFTTQQRDWSLDLLIFIQRWASP